METKHQPHLRQQSEESQLSKFPVHLCVPNHIIEFMVDIWKLIKKETLSLARSLTSRVKGLRCRESQSTCGCSRAGEGELSPINSHQ